MKNKYFWKHYHFFIFVNIGTISFLSQWWATFLDFLRLCLSCYSRKTIKPINLSNHPSIYSSVLSFLYPVHKSTQNFSFIWPMSIHTPQQLLSLHHPSLQISDPPITHLHPLAHPDSQVLPVLTTSSIHVCM